MASEDIRRNEQTGNIILEGRQRLSVSGVDDVLSFDEGEITADTAEGALVIRGEQLHVERLSLDSGELIITGHVDSMEYMDGGRQKGSFWSKLF